jgi:hypothetical protein
VSGPLALLRRSAIVWAPTSVVVVAAQAALVLGDPVPLDTVTFLALALLSLVLVIAAVAVSARALAVTASGERVAWRGVITRDASSSWAWAAILVLVTAVLAVLLPPLALIGVLLVVAIMPIAGRGSMRVWGPVGAAIRVAPVRGVLLGFVTILASVLVVVAALLLGFFVTGVASVLATWFLASVTALKLLAGATAYASRSSAVDRSGVKKT